MVVSWRNVYVKLPAEVKLGRPTRGILRCATKCNGGCRVDYRTRWRDVAAQVAAVGET